VGSKIELEVAGGARRSGHELGMPALGQAVDWLRREGGYA
jgi:hypothetical protein